MNVCNLDYTILITITDTTGVTTSQHGTEKAKQAPRICTAMERAEQGARSVA